MLLDGSERGCPVREERTELVWKGEGVHRRVGEVDEEER